jgi:N-glycosidase YbiA
MRGVLIIAMLCIGQLYAGKGRAVVFAEHNGEVYILLGKDVGTTRFSDFGAIASEYGRRPHVALEALAKQTNNQYTPTVTDIVFSTKGSPYTVQGVQTEDSFFYIKQLYLPGNQLYQKARNSLKEDFSWVPVTTISKGLDTVLYGPQGSKKGTIAPDLFFQLQADASGIVHNRSGSSGTHNPVKIPSSWFDIPGAILFYQKDQPYYQFTNFWENDPIVIDGIVWQTTEHYYQAQKYCKGSVAQKAISLAPTARDVFDIGQIQSKLRKGDVLSAQQQQFWNKHKEDALSQTAWEAINLQEMTKAVREKFTQHKTLRDLLLSTADSVLVENAGIKDGFYGAGADGKGLNHLGKILMKIRAQLRNGSLPSPYSSAEQAATYTQWGDTHQDVKEEASPQLLQALRDFEQQLLSLADTIA